MSLYNGPPRPGARGGRGEFSWDNVKSDKDREFYLGHSVKAGVGRWQKGKDVFWYNKGKEDMGVTQDELEAVKAREREMMAEALGLKPKSAPSTHSQPALEKHEVERLLKCGADDQDPSAAGAEADRMKGLGFKAGAAVAVREEVHEVLAGTVQPGSRPAARGQLLTVEQLAAMDKASAGAAAGRGGGKPPKSKKSKKEKKEKKDKREKHKKRKRERSRSRDSSSSSDSDRGRRNHSRQQQQQQQPPHQQELNDRRSGRHYSPHRQPYGGEDRGTDEGRLPLRRGDSTADRHVQPVREAADRRQHREPDRQPGSSWHDMHDREGVVDRQQQEQQRYQHDDRRGHAFEQHSSRHDRDSQPMDWHREGGGRGGVDRGFEARQQAAGDVRGAGVGSRKHRSRSGGRGRSRSPCSPGRYRSGGR